MATLAGALRGITATPEPSRFPVDSNGQRLCSTPKLVRAAGGVRSHASQTLKTIRECSGMRNHSSPTPKIIQVLCVLPGSLYIKSGKEYSTDLGKLWQRRMYKGRIRCHLGGTSSSEEDEIGPDANVQSTLGENDAVQFDLDLPRRSLLLEFTCNVCQARTQRMINPDALRRGTVYVQCGGCQAYHQLVDNLNLVEEYDFKNEVDPLRNDLNV